MQNYAQALSMLPFAGVLLSIAFLPLVLKKRWHSLENYILLFWSIGGALAIFLTLKGSGITAILHMVVQEYIPFISLITALYVISSGIVVRTHLHATPWVNVGVLLLGSVLANFIGTMGASMVLIRPYLHVNRQRKYFAHGVIFFIFCVCNIGGILSSIADPPLFLGFLKGVSFWWPFKMLWPVWTQVISILLLIFWVIDRYFYKKEGHVFHPEVSSKITIRGRINFLILLLVVLVLVASSAWMQGPCITCNGVKILISNIVRDACLIGIATVAYILMPKTIRYEQLDWAPVREVCKVFFVIFFTMIPLHDMLHQGTDGPFSGILSKINQSDPAVNYFWLSGLFSAVLDNAPTYLLFFDLAGGNAKFLMNEGAQILSAISLGCVFMGAITYIGNAPNFMIKSIARNYKIRMPSFFGYMVWSCTILLPIFYGVSIWITKLTP